MAATQMTVGDTVPSHRHIRVAFDRIAALSRAYPCHTLVRPARVRSGAVLDAVAPMDPDTRQAARDHYRGGGIVRLHGRRPADLESAREEIIS
jgi:hypothetical protein